MRRWVVAAGTVVVLSVAACEGEANEDAAPVLAPGAPGESATPATDEQIEAAAEAHEHNEDDVEFMIMMIVHHEQALEMTDLVPDRSENSDIEAIADRMATAQGAEIESMEEWLEANVYGPARENPAHQNYCGLEEHLGHADHQGADCALVEHDDMPGMATAEEMAALADAEGKEFDEMFVELMVTHHEGGIEMAEDVLLSGQHPPVLDMAQDIMVEQQAEINRMHGIIGEDAE